MASLNILKLYAEYQNSQGQIGGDYFLMKLLLLFFYIYSYMMLPDVSLQSHFSVLQVFLFSLFLKIMFCLIQRVLSNEVGM